MKTAEEIVGAALLRKIERLESVESENAAMKESLAELIKIVEYYHDNQVTYTEMPYKNWATAIEHAKKLLNKTE